MWNQAGQLISACDSNLYIDAETKKANARLIAAAPELLAQLKRAVMALDAERIHCTPDKATAQVFAWWDDILKEARAAIAKAEGKL